MPRALTALCLLALAFTVAAAEPDWPTFRGADRTGVSKEKGLLPKWEKDEPKLAWKAEGVGIGFSSVSVMGDKVFTLGDVEKSCYLFAIDRKKGGKLWELKVGAGGPGGQWPGPRCTPSTDGELVFALNSAGDLVCATVDGKEVWRKSFTKDFDGKSGVWNYTESPLIDGNRVIVTPGSPKAAMVALDKKTGKTEWAGTIDDKGERAGYASVVIAECGGVKQYVTLMGHGLVSFAAKDGKMLWRYGANDTKIPKDKRFYGTTANIPTPIVRGDYVFATAGYDRGAALLKITKSGDEFMVEEVYWKPELKNKHGGVVLVGDKLFGDRDDSGSPWCADFKTGEEIWTRKGGNGGGSAAITYADGKLYIHYANSWVVLVDATADKYTEVGSFQVAKGNSQTWAHPVVVGGKLYIRELETLYCYGIAAK